MLLPLSALALLTAGAAPAASPPPPASVLVVAPDDGDPRLAPLREALALWNDTFAELGLRPAFDTPRLVATPIGLRALENHAWRLSRLAGRVRPGDRGPAPPESLLDLPADLVVLLSAQKLMPLAWPLPESRHFVAIPADPEAAGPEIREVIAHELGHALGLEHNQEGPGALMCQPCARPGAEAATERPVFLRLTALERARLLELFGKP